jgi:hypothetical protein
MAKIPISSVKSQFESGDRPNGDDYINLIDTTAAQATDLGTAGNNELTITGIENTTVIDSFVASEWRMVKYLISISKITNGDNKFYSTELSILIDGSNLSTTEYGVIDNDGDMGTISVSRSGGNVNIVYQPDPAIKPVTVRFGRIGLKA